MVGHAFLVAAGLSLFPSWDKEFFFPLKIFIHKLGSGLTPSGSVDLQLPCLSLMSLQTKICSRTWFDREEKSVLLLLGLEKLFDLDAINFGSLLFLVVPCGDCYNSSCLTSDYFFKNQALYSSKDGRLWKKEPCIQPFLLLTSNIWSIQLKQTETMDVMWMRGRGSTTPCNWFSKPESSEVALHMELNCDLPLYQHFHNPLPTLQQAPWQRTEADNTLSKQVHIAADNIVHWLWLWLVLLTGQPVSWIRAPAS